MRRLIILFLICFILAPEVLAFKSYYYNERGERVYIEITPEIAYMNKYRPRRTFVRQPRNNWEITPAMRARKMTSSQYTHRGNG